MNVEQLALQGKGTLFGRPKSTINDPKRSNRSVIHTRFNVLNMGCFFFQILGCGVLGVGVWLLVKEFNTREMSAIMGSRLVEMITYGLIAGGGAATILAFCGCCGTMKQEKFVLGFVSD